jgi:hypothetical protein
MSQNNLLDVVNFMKENKTFSDYNFINDFMSSLNFTKYRFNNNAKKLTGGASASALAPAPAPEPDSSTILLPDASIPLTDVQSVQGVQGVQDAQIPPPPMIPLSDGSVPMIPLSDGSVPMIPLNYDIIPEVEVLNEEISGFGSGELTMGINDNAECVYKKIKNPDGTYITQKICGQKIVTMPDMFLPKPTFMYSGTNTYTVKKGTILYHATVHKRGFNTNEIRLGKDRLISFFTPNFRLASDKIEGCSIDKQKGFIHVFEVKTDIPDIFIKLPYDTDEDLNLDELKDKFCNGNEYYKGVGFFYPKNEIELFNNSVFNQRTQEMHENLDDDSYYSEFALCSPNDYLTYLYSQKCMSLRKLSQPYRFDGKNYN